jgi:hypothetical protein
VAGAATLTATPEPGSFFLPGMGLPFMALALFLKTAKQRLRRGLERAVTRAAKMSAGSD